MAYHERFNLDLHIISTLRKVTVMIRLEYIANACGFHFEDSKLGCTSSKQSSAILKKSQKHSSGNLPFF
ncbi:bf97e5a1-c00c-44a9-81fb-938c77ad7684-CDS [Sclerotinia trifoliorum]|uniref:Bf97e5a1-c00c-44a9-81fb-938c77ad7684-CDS n=1 Tax=Sclerotinia trifoliorum TaxID=28548 RepID=A0A8H2ZPB7_9HELO|nr:bf97e5a1-c00c-44a9-81fb-938c77ad7684-CDS [Sclerotinia trifoliorum]